MFDNFDRLKDAAKIMLFTALGAGIIIVLLLAMHPKEFLN